MVSRQLWMSQTKPYLETIVHKKLIAMERFSWKENSSLDKEEWKENQNKWFWEKIVWNLHPIPILCVLVLALHPLHPPFCSMLRHCLLQHFVKETVLILLRVKRFQSLGRLDPSILMLAKFSNLERYVSSSFPPILRSFLLACWYCRCCIFCGQWFILCSSHNCILLHLNQFQV